MTFEDFMALCESSEEPTKISRYLRALWRDHHGDWDGAHEMIQDGSDPMSAAIHAYLHRKEGDLSNARYWYGTANRAPFKGPLDEEWESLARENVGQKS